MLFLRSIILLSSVLFSVAFHTYSIKSVATTLHPLDVSNLLLATDSDDGKNDNGSPARGDTRRG